MMSKEGAPPPSPSSQPLPPPPPPLARVSTIDCSATNAAAAIRESLTTLGCFYGTGLGIKRATVASLLSRSRSFFSLPLETKMKIKSDSNFRGYTPMNDERLGGNPAGDFKEGVYFGRDLTDEGDPLFGLPLHGPNQWPSEEDAPGYKEAVEGSFEEFRGAAQVLMRLVAEALGIDADFFVRKFEGEEEEEEKKEEEKEKEREKNRAPRRSLAMDFIRTLHYAPVVSRPESGELGCGAHCDYGFATLLVTDGVPGLQIFDEAEKRWCLVPAAAPWPPANDPKTSRPAPAPSTSVLAEEEGEAMNLDADDGSSSEFPVFINAGDMIHRWSNGAFKSALHRVSLPEGRDRYSAAFFFDPPWACSVAPLASVSTTSRMSSEELSPTNRPPPLFPATTYGDYLVAKFKQTHGSFEGAAGEEVEKRRKMKEKE